MLGVAVLGAGDIANTHIEAFCQLKNRCRIIALADAVSYTHLTLPTIA